MTESLVPSHGEAGGSGKQDTPRLVSCAQGKTCTGGIVPGVHFARVPLPAGVTRVASHIRVYHNLARN
jgi:hypothetical protein